MVLDRRCAAPTPNRFQKAVVKFGAAAAFPDMDVAKVPSLVNRKRDNDFVACRCRINALSGNVTAQTIRI